MIEIDVSQVEGVLGKKAENLLLEISNELVNLLKEEAPVDTGQLRQSLQIMGYGEHSIYVGTRLKYASAVQFGSPPHTPNMESLKKWTRRKLGKPESVAYKIADKIEEKGTKPNPFVDRAIDRLRKKYV